MLRLRIKLRGRLLVIAAFCFSILPVQARITVLETAARLAVGVQTSNGAWNNVDRTWANFASHADSAVRVSDIAADPIIASGNYDMSISLNPDWLQISGEFRASLADPVDTIYVQGSAILSYHLRFYSNAPFAFAIMGTPENLGGARARQVPISNSRVKQRGHCEHPRSCSQHDRHFASGLLQYLP